MKINIKEFWIKLPKWAKAIITIVVLGITAFVIWKIFLWIKQRTIKK